MTITSTVASPKKRQLTVDDLKSDQPIFVYNRSRGDHTISVRTGDGGIVPITVPRTFIPVQITEQIAPSVLKQSEDFRKACYKGVFILVDPVEAEKVLETPDAVEELERLRALSNYSGVNFLKDDDISVVEASKNTNIQVSIRVKDTLMQDISQEDKLSILKNEDRLNSMNKQDFEYIISTTETNSKLSKWATDRLSNFNNNILK